ncbi:MAG: RNA 3'-terminal phosphate cyclase [Deltaproteobacteria bacterium]|nr:RNA 3'-terminal phosphate cyclase [Deltaproteobacteria bacterium]
MIHIDGSFSEGGGQILRTALALSSLTGRSFRAERIRQNRPAPGLKPQHLSAIEALIRMSGARARGARVGAGQIEFVPGNLTSGYYSLDIGTAGAVTLLMQALLLPCMFAGGKMTLRITGGTDTRWSIPMDYFTHLILPVFRRCCGIEVIGMQRGFYPKGRGVLELMVQPGLPHTPVKDARAFQDAVRRLLPRLDLSARREMAAIKGVSVASSFLAKARVAERQAESAYDALGSVLPAEIHIDYCRSASPGTVITLWTVDKEGRSLVGADALGEKGKPAEAVGREAAHKLLETLHTEAAVDVHLADNLIPLLAFVGGKIKTASLTDHIRANIYVCERFLDVRFKVDEAAALMGVG